MDRSCSQSTDFIERLMHVCKKSKKKLLLPEWADPRISSTAKALIENEAVSCIGIPDRLWNRKLSNDHTWRIKHGSKLVSYSDLCVGYVEMVDEFIAKRRASKKPIDESQVRDSAFYHSGFILQSGAADACIAGVSVPTGDVVRAAIHTVGMMKDIRTVSGSFLMLKDDQVYLFADCGVVVDPSMNQLVDIAAASVDTWRQLQPLLKTLNGDGVQNIDLIPKVAFLSFSTSGSAIHPLSKKMADAYNQFAASFPLLDCAGEIQLDAALDPKIRQKKSSQWSWGGSANILIFPDLQSGNISYKMAQRLGGFVAIGPNLQGLSRRYSDLSRGATQLDILGSALLNCM